MRLFARPISGFSMTSSPFACPTCFKRTAATAAAHASSSTSSSTLDDSHVDLSFPSHKNPTPFEVFHFDANERLSTPKVRKRYYELARLYHPDQGAKGKGKDTEEQFKVINAAYELLRNARSREAYVRSGIGWSYGAGGARARRAGYSQAQAQWDMRHAAYDFRRGRPMSNGWRGSNTAWDYEAARGGPFNAYPGYGGPAHHAGWSSQGMYASNGTIFLVLLSLTVVITPLRLWSTLPPDVDEQGRWMGRDSKHQEAARNLENARREARVNATEKREALRSVLVSARLMEARLMWFEQATGSLDRSEESCRACSRSRTNRNRIARDRTSSSSAAGLAWAEQRRVDELKTMHRYLWT